MTYYKTVYLVDSDEDDRFIYQQVIETINETITIKQSVSIDEFLSSVELEGLALPSLIIVDTYAMSGAAGLNDLLNSVCKPGVHIIMITSFSEIEIKNRAFGKGILKCFVKPTSFAELSKLLKELIAGHL